MKLISLNSIQQEALPHRDREYFNYFIHLILREQDFNDLDRDEFVPISSKALENVLRKKYIPVREYLKHTGLIESDNVYRKQINENDKGKCYGFRLSEHFQNGNRIFIEAGEKISKRIEAFRKNQIISRVAEIIQSNLNMLEVDPYIYQLIEGNHKQDLSNLAYNLQALKKDYPRKYKVVDGKRILKNTPYEKRIQDKYDSDIYKAKSLNNRPLYVVEDNTAKRVHTPITNLNRDYRKCLSVNGENLVNVDISNSQPFLLAVLANDFYKSDTPKDVKELLDITSRGVFYEYLMERMNYTGDRNSFKVATYANIVFSNTAFKKERFAFDKIFPNVSKVIDYYKRFDYRNLPVKLQQLERSLIIDGACSGLNDVWFSTIHDSILVKAGHEGLAKQKINETFTTHCGIVPQIKFEYLN